MRTLALPEAVRVSGKATSTRTYITFGVMRPRLLKGIRSCCCRSVLGFIMLASTVVPASSATLQVGAGKVFKDPSEAAAAAAKSGDVVRIDPGTYYDCAVWTAGAAGATGWAAGAAG